MMCDAAADNLISDDEFDDLIDKACEQDICDIEIDETRETHGSSLSKGEREAAHQLLAAWHDVDGFKAETDKLCSRCTGKDWFNLPQLKFLHDAFVLARFACDEGCNAVSLAASLEQWPDGYVRRQGRFHNVEIVSTHGGRKLGKEYATVTGPQSDPVADWVKRANSIPFYLDEAIRKKALKRYSAPCWLVVYLNIDEWGIRHRQVVEHIESAKKLYSTHFEAISVRWKGLMY